jgi:hypothetical protein
MQRSRRASATVPLDSNAMARRTLWACERQQHLEAPGPMRLGLPMMLPFNQFPLPYH